MASNNAGNLRYRIGYGYDIHRLEPLSPQGAGKPMVLGGLRVEHDRGPVGHSDADVVLHAATDAILGGLGQPDIGQLFPDTDPQWADADSAHFLREAVKRMADAGYSIANLDITVICEQPKIGPLKEPMKTRIAELLSCDTTQVNIKGKTHEGVDAVGEGRAIEGHAVVLLQRIPK